MPARAHTQRKLSEATALSALLDFLLQECCHLSVYVDSRVTKEINWKGLNQLALLTIADPYLYWREEGERG